MSSHKTEYFSKTSALGSSEELAELLCLYDTASLAAFIQPKVAPPPAPSPLSISASSALPGRSLVAPPPFPATVPAAPSAPPSHRDTARLLADAATDFPQLRAAIDSFDGCPLKFGATQTVFADGNPQSDIMLIGEAPGANEDIHGIPFCGQSGKLLDNILLACRLDRTKVYISNAVFWRPPDNRRPTYDEIAVCRPFVEKHIALVAPRLIIMVGNTALTALTDEQRPLGQIRGKFYNYTNRYLPSPAPHPVAATAIYHPSYLLRQPGQKKQMWFDMLRILDFLAARR